MNLLKSEEAKCFFASQSAFLAKSPKFGIFYFIWCFLTLVRAAVVGKLLILGVLSSTSFILALRAEFVAKLVILGVLHLTSFIFALSVVSNISNTSVVSNIKYFTLQNP